MKTPEDMATLLGEDTDDVFATFNDFRIKSEAQLGILPKFNFTFLEPDELDFLFKIIHPDNFLAYCMEKGMLDSITGNYSYDCEKLCENSVAYILLELKRYGLLEKTDYEIHSGTFCHLDHTWLRIGKYYVDLTLAQFLKGVPELAVTRISETKGQHMYQSDWQYIDVETWLE